MVPSLSTQYGGIRTLGKTAEEAMKILKDMKRLEDAGAFGAEVRCCGRCIDRNKKAYFL